MTDLQADSKPQDLRFVPVLLTGMAGLLVSGFVLQLAMGRSSFSAPLVVHAHAVIAMGWVAIVLAQAWLAAAGGLTNHRLLGRIAGVYAVAMAAAGVWVTVAAVQTGRVPFFFQPQHFLLVDPATLAAFLGLLIAAIVMRKQTAWHARLQIGAFVPLLGPGIGRLLPLPLLTPYAFEIAALTGLIAPIIGMARDLKVHGRIHPAWYWTIFALVFALVAARLAAFSPLGDSLYAAVTAGTPLEGSDGRAFPAPPGPPPLAM